MTIGTTQNNNNAQAADGDSATTRAQVAAGDSATTRAQVAAGDSATTRVQVAVAASETTNQIDNAPRAFSVFRFGTAEFDEARLELRVAGLPVDIERRALEVLAYLLRHAGEVVTKEELLREVWAGRITVEKVLPNAINKLRRALGESNSAHIVTQARVGYRLDGVTSRQIERRALSSSLALQAGQSLAQREHFVLRQQLSARSGVEVWIAEHSKSPQKRVYKLCTEQSALRALKREATLSRVLQESIEDRSHFVDIVDWNFESAPFFLETEYIGPNLSTWAKTELHKLTQAQRLALFLQIADAIAAAHAVGVLHKDLKPSNVLMQADPNQAELPWRAVVTDFGSGRLLDPEQLEKLGITQLSETMTQNYSEDSSSGTPIYIAPEVFSGQVPNIKNDVYALGILLYQLLVGHINRPIASGWEADINDPLLCTDIQQATEGNPERRFTSVSELTNALRDRPARVARLQEQSRIQSEAQAARQSVALSRARRPYLIAFISALIVGVIAAAWFAVSAVQARDQAKQELARANTINQFLTSDLISRSNPAILANGSATSLKDILLTARERVGSRFAGQALAEASIRQSMSELFNTIDLWTESEAEARRALKIYSEELGARSFEALATQSTLVRVLARMAKYDQAKEELTNLQFSLGKPEIAISNAQKQYLEASAASSFYFSQGDFQNAIPYIERAIQTLPQVKPDNKALIDSMRLDQIYALTMRKRFAEAQSIGTAQITDLQQRPGDQQLWIALTRLMLARSYSYQRKNDIAESLLLQAQPIVETRLGMTHSTAIGLQTELMAIAFRQANWPKAIPVAEKIYQSASQKFGPRSRQAGMVLANLGRCYFESGQAKIGRDKLRQAYEVVLEVLGPSGPGTHDTAFILAAAELEVGNLEAAEQLLDGLDANILESFNAQGIWPTAMEALRGWLLYQRGDLAAAKPKIEAGLQVLGPKTAEEPIDRVYYNLNQIWQTYQQSNPARASGVK